MLATDMFSVQDLVCAPRTGATCASMSSPALCFLVSGPLSSCRPQLLALEPIQNVFGKNKEFECKNSCHTFVMELVELHAHPTIPKLSQPGALRPLSPLRAPAFVCNTLPQGRSAVPREASHYRVLSIFLLYFMNIRGPDRILRRFGFVYAFMLLVVVSTMPSVKALTPVHTGLKPTAVTTQHKPRVMASNSN